MNQTTAAIENSLEGRELPQDQPVRCRDCHARLREGEPVTVAANQHEGVWRLSDVWCAPDAPVPWSHDTDDVLVEGDIGLVSDVRNQRHYPVVVRATLLNGRRRAVEA